MHSADYILLGGVSFVALGLLSIKIYATWRIARIRRARDARPLPVIELPPVPDIRNGPARVGDVGQLLYGYEATLRTVGNLLRERNAETSPRRRQGITDLTNQSTAHLQLFRSAALTELMRCRPAEPAAEPEGRS